MKKQILIISLVFLLSCINVNADPFAIIATTGLSFVNPAASAIVNGVFCITGPTGLITCATNYVGGKIIGQVQGEALNQIAQSGDLGEKAVKAITTHNQIMGYVDQGAVIIEELKLNEDGVLVEGEVGGIAKNGENIGNLLGLKKEDAFAQNIDITFVKSDAHREYDHNMITFNNENGRFWLRKNELTRPFENIKKQDDNNPAYLILDKKGNLLEARFTVSKDNSNFIFNDPLNPLTLKEGQRVYYKYGVIKIEGEKDTNFNYGNNIIKFKEIDGLVKIDADEVIKCQDCYINDLRLSGSLKIKDKGYFIQHYSEVEKFNFLLSSGKDSFLLANNDLDMSNYQGNYVKVTDKYIIAKSFRDEELDIEFLEGNKIFNLDPKNLKPSERKFIKLSVKNGDAIDVASREKELPLILHSSSEGGYSGIKNGRTTISLYKDDFYNDYGEINEKILKQVPVEIKSKSLGDNNVLIFDSKDGFVINDEVKQENVYVFMGDKLAEKNYEGDSKVGEQIFDFAKEQIGDSAFVWGGRGDKYYKEGKRCNTPSGGRGFDCIGLAQTALATTYNKKLNEFPPNILLEKKLKGYGWESSIIEPSSVSQSTLERVKDIPQGSIVYLMHEYPKDDPCDKNFDCYEYKGKNLIVGHTLIKSGNQETNFINAIPVGYDELMPRFALEHNKKLREEGKPPLFIGVVKEGNLVPKKDYLLVMEPPKNE